MFVRARYKHVRVHEEYGRAMESVLTFLSGWVLQARTNWRRKEVRVIHEDDTAGWLDMKTTLEGLEKTGIRIYILYVVLEVLIKRTSSFESLYREEKDGYKCAG